METGKRRKRSGVSHPQFTVTCAFPAPQPDDEARHVALLRRLIEIGRPVAERRRELTEQLRVALEDGNTERVVEVSRELCGA
jgi:hypothetical protein